MYPASVIMIAELPFPRTIAAVFVRFPGEAATAERCERHLPVPCSRTSLWHVEGSAASRGSRALSAAISCSANANSSAHSTSVRRRAVFGLITCGAPFPFFAASQGLVKHRRRCRQARGAQQAAALSVPVPLPLCRNA